MYKILLGFIFLILVGCASSPNNMKDKTISDDRSSVHVKVYEINDPQFNNLKSGLKDQFIENVTSHITDVKIETALSKLKYVIKYSYDFKLEERKQISVGDETVNDSRKNTGMMIVAEKNKELIVFNVFNRTSVGNAYANSLSEITMNLLPDIENKIAYRIAENEILYITIDK